MWKYDETFRSWRFYIEAAGATYRTAALVSKAPVAEMDLRDAVSGHIPRLARALVQTGANEYTLPAGS